MGGSKRRCAYSNSSARGTATCWGSCGGRALIAARCTGRFRPTWTSFLQRAHGYCTICLHLQNRKRSRAQYGARRDSLMASLKLSQNMKQRAGQRVFPLAPAGRSRRACSDCFRWAQNPSWASRANVPVTETAYPANGLRMKNYPRLFRSAGKRLLSAHRAP